MAGVRLAGFLHKGGDERRGAEAGLEFAGVIEELGAPAAVVVEDLVEVRAAGRA